MRGGPRADTYPPRQLGGGREVGEPLPPVAEVANLVERARVRPQVAVDEPRMLPGLGEDAEAPADLREQAENHDPAPGRERATMRNPIDSSGWRRAAARFQRTRRAYGVSARPPTTSIKPASGVSYTTGITGSVGVKPPPASSASRLSRVYSTLWSASEKAKRPAARRRRRHDISRCGAERTSRPRGFSTRRISRSTATRSSRCSMTSRNKRASNGARGNGNGTPAYPSSHRTLSHPRRRL